MRRYLHQNETISHDALLKKNPYQDESFLEHRHIATAKKCRPRSPRVRKAKTKRCKTFKKDPNGLSKGMKAKGIDIKSVIFVIHCAAFELETESLLSLDL